MTLSNIFNSSKRLVAKHWEDMVVLKLNLAQRGSDRQRMNLVISTLRAKTYNSDTVETEEVRQARFLWISLTTKERQNRRKT